MAGGLGRKWQRGRPERFRYGLWVAPHTPNPPQSRSASKNLRNPLIRLYFYI